MESYKLFQFPEEFVWLFPWRRLDDDYIVMNFDDPNWCNPSTTAPSTLLVDELKREMVAGHKLYGETVEAVAVYTLTHKDFLFTSDNPNKPIACVHLTWSKETDPLWPSTHIYNSLDEWVDQMSLEHREYKHLMPKRENPGHAG